MTESPVPVTLTPLLGFPEVKAGDDLSGLVLKVLQDNGVDLQDGDVLVVSSKVVSKAMGLRASALELADVVTSQTVRVVAERVSPSGLTRIVEAVAGPVMAAGGVDASNTTDPSTVLLLPPDPDAVAADLRNGLQSGWARLSGNSVRLGVILSDTAGRPWRIGQTDFALGAAGVQLVDDLRGTRDADGRTLTVTERCVGDEIAAAADLVKGKTSGIPAAHIRGLGQHVDVRAPGSGARGSGARGSGARGSGARGLVRTGPQDWFSYGAAEAVRAALGVEPGSTTASEVGIPSLTAETMPAETVATRADRALRVALTSCPEVAGRVDGHTVRLAAVDAFALGVAATRALVALHGEGLTTTLTRCPDRPPEPAGTLTAESVVQIDYQPAY